VTPPTLDPAVDLVVRASLALLLLDAALHKALRPASFRAVLADYRLLPGGALAAAGAALVATEAALAAALGVPGLRAAALRAVAALLLLYGAAIAANLARGRRHIACGCGAAAGEAPLSAALVARNAVLAALALLAAAVPPGPRALAWPDALAAAGACAALAALYAAAHRLLALGPATARLRGAA
jgi:hypothetical protein